MPPASFFQTISLFLHVPRVSPGHLGLKAPYLPTPTVDKVLFFSLTSRQCLPGSCGGSSFRFPSTGPAGKGGAMTLLVTSDTAQPLSADQMEGKCKWETSGWRSGQAADQPEVWERACMQPKRPESLLLHCDSVHIHTTGKTTDLRVTARGCHIHFFFWNLTNQSQIMTDHLYCAEERQRSLSAAVT